MSQGMNVGERPADQYEQRTAGEQMQALCFVRTGKVEMRQVRKPVVTNDEDAIIRVTGTTICGSDLHLLHNELPMLKNGDILGHETMGIIESVGPAVTKFRVGDRVVAAFNIACGKCSFCQQSLFTMCEVTNKSADTMDKMYGDHLAGVLGYSHLLGGFAGGQAEYARIPYANTNLVKPPDNLPDEKALFLSDVVPTSYHAVVESGIQPGDYVGIWGAGPIGLLCAQWCKNVFKAEKVFLIDNVQERLDLGKEKWGIETINFSNQDVAKTIREKVPLGLDRAIDAAGFRYAQGILHKVERAVGMETDTSEILNEIIMCVKKFGTISVIADYVGYTNHLNIGAIMEKGIRFIGCGQAPIQAYWQICIEKMTNGLFDPTEIVTHRAPLEKTAELYYQFDKKEAGMIKTFIETKFTTQ
jgi:threonine dehydrogenase-like Zn-dependent dehydrogenase